MSTVRRLVLSLHPITTPSIIIMASPDVSLQPPSDGISSLSWSPDSRHLLVSSWDGTLQLHDTSSITPTSSTTFPPRIIPAQLPSPSPILTTTYASTSNNTAYSAGLDRRLREWDLERGVGRVLGKGGEAMGSAVWSGEINAVITGSWDKTLRVWDPRLPTAQVSSNLLPQKIYNLATSPVSNTLLVSMGHRIVHTYDVRMLATGGGGEGGASGGAVEPLQQRESALKFLTRSIACMIDGKGWASASIEGRIAVEYFDQSPEAQAQKYAFRCHRQTVDGVENAYPINALAYHPIHNTFVSGGSDATVSIWDHLSKKRMKLYPKYVNEISALQFSPDGEKLAIGVSYEHDNGMIGKEEGELGARALMIKTSVMDDCRPKSRPTTA